MRNPSRMIRAASLVTVLTTVAALLFLVTCRGSSVPPALPDLAPRPDPSGSTAPTVDHTVWDELLKEFVTQDRVDYEGLLGERSRLDRYLEALEQVPRDQLTRWPRADQMAFWINAYNAWTVQAILDAWPLERRGLAGLRFPARSIRQVPDAWSRVRPIAGGEYSLDDVEHAILRPLFRDPRIHFAVNCASKSCPPLRAEAFVGSRLEQQLDEQARAFLADTSRNRIDPVQDVVELSKIFEWFGQDFGGPQAFETNAAAPAAVLERIGEWLDADLRQAVKDFPAGDVEYLSYDWSLND